MSIQLTPAERGAYGHFFALADPSSTGVVSGQSAVSFFALSGLPSPVLGTIWTLSDQDNNGFLTPAQFSIALRLIGHAQSGKVVTEDLVNQPSPLPTFKGIALPPHLSAAAGSGVTSPVRSSSMFVQPQLTGNGSSLLSNPPGSAQNAHEIRPEDRARYTRIFAGAGPQGGLLDGEKAKEIFVKSKLPFDKLGAIWNLADTKARGKLDLTDFTIGMHFIQSTMNGSLTTIPATLPAGLYERAAGGAGPTPGSPLSAQMTGGSVGSSMIPRQMTGQGTPSSPVPSTIRSPSMLQPQRTGFFAGGAGSSFSAAAPAPTWAVSPADKAKADQFFDGLDQEKKGILEGQAAVPFFMQSGLNEATLAHVWDLSDITQSGTLTRDEFAVAMHLINLKLTGGELPQELPANVIPPSLRNQQLPQAVNPQETDTQRDLFSLMDDDVDLPVSTATAFAKPAVAATAAPTSAVASKGVFDSAFDDDFVGTTNTSSTTAAPFVASPQSALTALSPTPTGASASTAIAANANRSFAPQGSSSMDAANQRLALESTQKGLADLEQSKTELTRSVAADAHSIDDMKTRLETVRMRHQTETEAVRALQERHNAQTAELKRLREESVSEESELSRLKAEKDEIEQALMKDREDVRVMKTAVGERTKAKELLLAEIEKLKKEARQQKGLLAIGKKQLTQSESDVTKAQEELDAVKAGHQDADEQEHAAHGEVPVVSAAPSSIKSPAASVRSTNPFDRIQPPSTQSTTSAAFGGAVGAAAAGAGVAALAHHELHDGDAGTTQAPNPSVATDAEQADPFGLSTQKQEDVVEDPALREAATNTAAPGFDDNFGQDAETVAVLPPGGPPAPANVNQSFDDAFADLDHSAPGAQLDAPSVPLEQPSSESTVEQPSFDSQYGGPATLTEEPREIQEAVVPAAVDTEPSVTSAEPVEVTSADKGKGVDRAPERELDEDEEDSSDDDEGPEDVEGAGHHPVGGAHDAAESDTFAAANDVTTPSAAVAADRFPAVDDESVTSKAPIPAAGAAAAQPVIAETPSQPTSAVLPKSTDSEAGDAFHDASDDVARFESQDVPSSTPGSAFLPGHERFSTAVEGAESVQPSSGRAGSPAKARRAPPAVPQRSDTGASPFGGNEAALPATAAPSATPATASTMDDFDAAFEDLGPASEGAGNVTTTSTSGFDDTFGDADGFDFVPSFSSNNVAQASAPSNGVTVLGNNFDGFDSTFDNAFDTKESSTAKGAATTGAPNATTADHSTSNAGSGFSFEDAFAPAEAAPSAVPAAAPAIPARRNGPPSTTAASGTGALPDDAGPVKQLCGMGFTRDNVIKALEKSNYRTDKALERLLAAAS